MKLYGWFSLTHRDTKWFDSKISGYCYCTSWGVWEQRRKSLKWEPVAHLHCSHTKFILGGASEEDTGVGCLCRWWSPSKTGQAARGHLMTCPFLPPPPTDSHRPRWATCGLDLTLSRLIPGPKIPDFSTDIDTFTIKSSWCTLMCGSNVC